MYPNAAKTNKSPNLSADRGAPLCSRLRTRVRKPDYAAYDWQTWAIVARIRARLEARK